MASYSKKISGEKNMEKHDPKNWHTKIWTYHPINYPVDNYFQEQGWWLKKIPYYGNKIMEVGCHTALSLLWIKKNFPQKDTIGIDINELVVHMARTRVYYYGLEVPVYLGNTFDLSAYNEQSKDIIFSEGLLEHFDEEDRIKIVHEQLRVAKYVLFVVPVKESLEKGGGYGDERKHTHSEWSEFTKKNFQLIEEFQNEENYCAIICNEKNTHVEEEHFNRMRQLVNGLEFESILDIGCGDGYLTSKFLDCGKAIFGIDKLENQIQKAKSKYPQVNFEVVDLENIEITGTFDLAIMCNVIYYLTQETQDRVMKNIYNNLTDTGYLITSRHMSFDALEFNAYKELFEIVKEEDVEWNGIKNKWHITLWKKKINLRSRHEIQEKIDEIESSKPLDFAKYGLLKWAIQSNLKEINKIKNVNGTNELFEWLLLEKEQKDGVKNE